ncbi:class I mannose-6-phosphate isomerase [Paenibacillus thermoaerophilus]|uniref:type I phosphomannose isomerase catalytic subunit n=1 Tax=Paenibacillus thermoaerophilus TaxID=1215385 RepID=UPI00110E30D7|nr:type I phosphomannose isomerase catalytic subunit [Paenibacillus thermoaerophilus]TMV15961.1 class I mannose-6-phosphate isomerase [Paenibacillus thermoaerophilus]
MQWYPLLFQPEFKERVWGGRNLERFGYRLPEGRIGEAWTIADHPNGSSVVANGDLAGLTLQDLRGRFGAELFGTRTTMREDGRFPLLVKLLDCEDDLSVQVHPSDGYDRLPPGELGKTEMWYILDAKPGAKIIYGLQPGIDRAALEATISEGRIMDALQEVPVSTGDSFYIPAGTVHALCSGVLVAEIQQNSDTTYRLYDYDRPGLDGKPRELHIEDSLNVTAYEGAGAKRMSTAGSRPGEWLELATSPYFVTDKGVVQGRWELETTPESFTILIVAEGEGEISWSGGELPLAPGQSYLLPAQLGAYALTGNLTVLRSRQP